MERIRDWGKDFSKMLHLQAESHLLTEPPDSFKEHKEGKLPVILIPGISYPWGVLRNVGSEISHCGNRVYTVPELGNNYSDIRNSAKIIEQAIPIDSLVHPVIIGFSYGGLIAKQIMLDTGDLVEIIIAVSAPFSGTDIAGIVPLKQFRNLSPGSSEIQRLSKETAVNRRIVSVFSEWDNLIPNGCELEGAENIAVPGKGHHRILYDDKLIWFINTRLELLELEKRNK